MWSRSAALAPVICWGRGEDQLLILLRPMGCRLLYSSCGAEAAPVELGGKPILSQPVGAEVRRPEFAHLSKFFGPQATRLRFESPQSCLACKSVMLEIEHAASQQARLITGDIDRHDQVN